MHRNAESYTYYGAYDRKSADLKKQQRLQRLERDGVAHGRYADKPGYPVRRHRCDKAGYEARVVQYADGYDLKGKDRRRERSPEQRREHRAHAAQGHKAHILIVQPEKPAYAVAYPAAYLQRRALASGRAAHQMCYRGGDEYHRHEPDVDFASVVDGVDDAVGALALHFGNAVDSRYGKASCGQEEYEPWVFAPHRRHPVNRQVKGRAHKAAYHARRRRKQHPAVKCSEIFSRLYRGAFYIRHGSTLLCAQN